MKRVLFVIIFIVILLVGWQSYNFLQPVDESSQDKILFEIERGMSTRGIADNLAENGLVHSSHFFRLVTIISNQDQNLQAGYYELSPADSLIDIMEDLSRGNISQMNITIPEGYTVDETAGRLAEITEYDIEDYQEAAGQKELVTEYFSLPENRYYYPTEGLLYPATYEIPRGLEPESILEIFIQEFTGRWKERLSEAEKGFSPFELITIASMVEKEAYHAEEKPLIAGIIFNRLEENMLLQIDATVQYGLEQWKEVLFYSDLQVDSYYNTYRHFGLPPGPIASPGDKALKAVLEPEETDYLFYFAVKDRSHVFSETYTEHLNRLEEFRQ